jgi:hypothetical protein
LLLLLLVLLLYPAAWYWLLQLSHLVACYSQDSLLATAKLLRAGQHT